LSFSPTAWAKLLFLRDYGDTEVGGFGISSADNLMRIEDIQLVKQTCSWAHVAFDDASIADFFDAQVDAGRQPEEFFRHWIHTHPGDSPTPSGLDEETFARVFGRSTWAVMFILAREGQSYARLQYHVGPGASFELPVTIDYSHEFPGCDYSEWEQEYLSNVTPQTQTGRILSETRQSHSPLSDAALWEEEAWEEFIDTFGASPDELVEWQQLLLEAAKARE